MLTEERYQEILAAVNDRKTVTVIELTKLLNASESTIRRDLLALDHMGKLNRVHGGATSLEMTSATKDLDMDVKYAMNAGEKRVIAAYAASLVERDDFVYVDAGSTSELFCDLVGEASATYVTNSIINANKLLVRGFHTLVLGGEVKFSTKAIVGPEAVECLSRFHFTKGFWGTNGAGPDQGFTTPDINEAEIKRISMSRCRSRYVLCDSSKFNQISPVSFAAFEDATIITAGTPDRRLLSYRNIVVASERNNR